MGEGHAGRVSRSDVRTSTGRCRSPERAAASAAGLWRWSFIAETRAVPATKPTTPISRACWTMRPIIVRSGAPISLSVAISRSFSIVSVSVLAGLQLGLGLALALVSLELMASAPTLAIVTVALLLGPLLVRPAARPYCAGGGDRACAAKPAPRSTSATLAERLAMRQTRMTGRRSTSPTSAMRSGGRVVRWSCGRSSRRQRRQPLSAVMISAALRASAACAANRTGALASP